MKTDFIIVGQGLAGTLLGFELGKAGKSVVFIDSPDYGKSSTVAAGLINPVVFKRLTQSWLIDDLFPQLEKTYAELEKLFSKQFYFPVKIRKILGEQEVKLWKKKAATPKLLAYLDPEPDTTNEKGLNLPFGSGWVKKGGRVDVKSLIETYQNYLLDKQQLRQENFDYKLVKIQEKGICYKDIEAEKIIFCEGHRNTQNPYFSNVRFKLTKGEVLTVELPDLSLPYILNKNGFLMDTGNHIFRLGATYAWDFPDERPTDEGKHLLLDKLAIMTTFPAKIIQHKSGIRPTTHDRRPVIGIHPQYPQLAIFNGLGSKGCMLAPYFARQFKDLLLGHPNDLNHEVRLERYYKL